MQYFGAASERMTRLRNKIHAQPFRICTQRAKIVTESYQEHKACGAVMKRAFALRDILSRISLCVEDDDLLMGYMTSSLRAAPIFPEYSMDWIISELDDFEKRPGDRFYPTEEQKAELREYYAFWKGNTVEDRAWTHLSEPSLTFERVGIIRAWNNMTCGDGHIALNYRKILEIGIAGYRQLVKEALARLDVSRYGDLQKSEFLKAVELVLDSIVLFAHRNADLAEVSAHNTADTVRKAELLEMAGICRRVPEFPARTFREALQCVWFLHMIIQMESNGHSVSFGRLDQFFYPYYEKDLREGRLAEEKACELLENLWIKLYSINKIRPWANTKFSAGSPLYENVTIGGQTADGRDAVNDLSYLIIKSVARMHLTQPNLTVRYHKGLSQRFLTECIHLIKEGFGMPAFNNDEIIIPSFIALGVEKEDACDYSAIGCSEVAVPGKWGYRCTGMSLLNMTKMLNVVLRGGYDDVASEQVVAPGKSWSDYKTFDELFDAWDAFCGVCARQCAVIDTAIDTAIEELAPDIAGSAFIDDCIERGLHLKQGGAKYDFVSGLQVGIANTGNALYALKKLVYDTKQLTMEEVERAVSANYEGVENQRVRNLLLHHAEKYGCDVLEVDEMVSRAYGAYIKYLPDFVNTRYGRGPIGGIYYAGTSSAAANVPSGAAVSATTDGRYAYAPLAEGCSPSSGTDTEGPTAVFKSVARLPVRHITGGVLLNQKMSPACIRTEEDIKKFSDLIRTFFDELKGFHVQYNYVDRSMLESAKDNPENYRDLIVRVAGYSAFFTVLNPNTQDDIIQRTEHTI
ncbi:MAG: glycyl radical protein [Christensenellales bacterium]